RAWDRERADLGTRLEQSRTRVSDLEKTQVRLETEIHSKEEILRHKDEESRRQQEETQGRFENLANRILHASTERLEQQSAKSISTLINPLREKLSDFERRVTEAYDSEARER